MPNRIGSFHQPWIRPIVRGKTKASVEFGAKFDRSMENGITRLERSSFDAYNESDVLISTILRYHDRQGCYPERVLADKIYRHRKQLTYCKIRGIRLYGLALGRPKKNERREKAIAYQDNTDRIELERCFSVGLVRTKRKDTTLSSIALSILSMNLLKLTADFLCSIFRNNIPVRILRSKISDGLFYRNLAIIQ